ncbi:hypothetical protein GH714_012816 [Hevea brasiliensis]|uniref:Uncharacterized protein n=1 Tax=Hevea brasiliensis TaxID=3981 RepID=A0A6A6KN52_HEVBR|nr:hypothetical protein GH714_012816 [Hevea brasiliensis]
MASLAWDLDTLQCIHILSGHNDAVTSFICWDQCLLSCSLDKTIKAWAFTEEGNLDVIYTHNEEHALIYEVAAFVKNGPSNWGPRGPHSSQPNPCDYHLRRPYPSQSSQYPPPSYGGYPPQQMGQRGNFGSGWEQRPPTMQGPVPHGGVYDYYSVQGGHVSDHPASGPISTPVSGHAPSPSPTPAMSHPPSQANYNYGRPHGPDYGHQAPYSQAVPSQQGFGHGYDEPKYDNRAPMQHPYGHGSSQPVYP